jgi:hypothetical protein
MIALAVGLIVSGIILMVMYQAQKKQLIEKYMNAVNTPDDFDCKFDPEKIKEGLDFFKTKRVIITGLLRDSDDNMPTIKMNVDKLAKLFDDYCVLVVENDSKDATRQSLLDWAKTNDKITVLGCGENADTCQLDLPRTIVHGNASSRIRKMVLLRNIYMDYIEQNPDKFDDFDFLVAIDMDILGTFYNDGMGSAAWYFMNDKTIQGLCANGVNFWNLAFTVVPRYHDPYAHVEDGNDTYKLPHVGPYWTVPTCTENPWKVKSCFNGFTIYRLSSIAGKQYKLEESNGTAACEHVSFNKQLDNIFMAPYLLFAIIENK